MAQQFGPDTWDRITPRHARLLGLLADDLTEREVAEALCTSEDAVKSAVERLKDLFGCQSARDLRRTWRAVWAEYVAYVTRVSGL